MKRIKNNLEPVELVNLTLLGFVVAVVPLIVFLRQVQLSETLQMFWVDEVNNDFFSFYKMFYLLLASLTLFIGFLAYISRKTMVKTYYYIPLAGYWFLAFMSSIFSDYPGVAFLGFPDRYEGFLVISSYLFLTVVAFNVIRDKGAVRLILGALLITSLILGVQGVLQYAGLDFFQSDFGKRMILPYQLQHLAGQIDFQFPSGIIYSTMFNPNYAGSYGAMLVVLVLGLFLYNRERRNMFILGSLSVLLFAYLLGSQSRAGMVGFTLGLIFLAVLFRHRIRNNWKPPAVLLLVFILIFVIMGGFTGNSFTGQLMTTGTEIDADPEEWGVPSLVNIVSRGNQLTIITEAVEVNAILENNNLTLLDEEQERLTYTMSLEGGEMAITMTEDDYQEHSFKLFLGHNLLRWEYGNLLAHFELIDGEFFILGSNDQPYELKDVPAWGFEGRESIGSARGYIWSRSLPLLRETLLTGHGCDTFALYFPQEDIVGKLKHYGSTHMIVDKPHNIFLQTAINTGMLSLLALLALWGGYVLQSLKLFWKSGFGRWEEGVGVAVFAAVVAYCVTGFFNDSVVAVAPVFWVLLGIGISMNLKVATNVNGNNKDEGKKKRKKTRGP